MGRIQRKRSAPAACQAAGAFMPGRDSARGDGLPCAGSWRPRNRTAPAAMLAVLFLAPGPPGALAQEPVPAAAGTGPDSARFAPGVRARIAAGEDPEVEAVRFTGVHGLAEGRLREAIASEASGCRSPLFALFCAVGDWDWAERRRFLSEAEPIEDQERVATVYRTWGYDAVRVEVQVVPDPEGDGDVVIDFHVREGDPFRVRSLALRGLDSMDPPVRLPEPLPLEVGDPYALPLLDATLQVIRGAFAERGHPYASVEVTGEVDEGTRTADLVLTAEPGIAARFGPVQVVAAAPLDEAVVRERLAYRPGEPFRPSALGATEEALYELAIVELASARPAEETGPDTSIETVVLAQTREAHGVAVESTLSSTDCLELAGFWQHRYFLGGPRLFTAGGGVSNLLASGLDGSFPCSATGEGAYAEPDYFLEGALHQPWPGSPRTRLHARAFVARESAPGVFVQEGWGGELGVGRALEAGLFVSLSWRPQRVGLDAAAIYFCGNYGVCTPGEVADLSRREWLAPLEAAAIWQPRGPLYPGQPRNPLPGTGGGEPDWRPSLRAALEVAGAPTGSAERYVRGVLEGVVVHQRSQRTQLAARARVGAVDGNGALPPQVRLYSGGVSTLRGVQENFLGPKVLVTDTSDLPALGCPVPEPGCLRDRVVAPDLVGPRPTGGQLLLEGSVEARLRVGGRLQLAAFVDAALLSVGERDPAGLDVEGGALMTPGVGIRIYTSMGPIRADLAYDPSGPERYPLLTRQPGADGFLSVGPVLYAPFTHDDPGFLRELWRRLQLQLAVGQPF